MVSELPIDTETNKIYRSVYVSDRPLPLENGCDSFRLLCLVRRYSCVTLRGKITRKTIVYAVGVSSIDLYFKYGLMNIEIICLILLFIQINLI